MIVHAHEIKEGDYIETRKGNAVVAEVIYNLSQDKYTAGVSIVLEYSFPGRTAKITKEITVGWNKKITKIEGALR